MTLFSSVQGAKVSRTKFDLSHEKKLSMQMGKLYPIMVEETVPGDKFNIRSETMVRFAPMLAPIMHRVNAYVHYFYVPNRLLWDDWEDFITGDKDVLCPKVELDGTLDLIRSLADYMGLPSSPLITPDIEANALPFRAYKLIYNEYYRDQNLSDAVDITDDTEYQQLYRRHWEKDYFTSALPWAQKGDAVLFQIDSDHTLRNTARAVDSGGTGRPALGDIKMGSDIPGEDYEREIDAFDGTGIGIDNIEEISGQIDINELRTAHRVQRWLERNARAGSRYVEHLLAHWGVRSSDARLDRPEYIGGGKSPVVISEVLNTAGNDEATSHPVGSMAGHGINVGTTNTASKYCEEHGYIIGIMSIIPKTAYHQGVPRKYARQLPTDFYFPEFARLGEQAVKNAEIFHGTNHEQNESTFGYQSRFAEYKYAQSMIHGDFRDELDFWHMGRIFNSMPTLNSTFVKATPTTRIFAVEEDIDNLWVQIYNQVIASRPMPFYSDPTL